MAVVHEQAAGATVLDDDFFHARIGEDLAAGGLDARDDGLGDAPAAADGIEAAVHVVARDQRVDDERRLRRGQAEVAPLAGEHGDQLLVLRERFQHFARAAAEGFWQQAIQQQLRQFQLPGLEQARRREQLHIAADFVEQLEVAVDGRLLRRKMLDQVGAEFVLAGDGLEDFIADKEAVIGLVHGRPVELAAAEEIHELARHRGRAHVADVVQAHVPLVAAALVAVGVAAGRVVLLQHRHLPADGREQRRRGEAARAGADDEGIVRAVEAVGAVALADAVGVRAAMAGLLSGDVGREGAGCGACSMSSRARAIYLGISGRVMPASRFPALRNARYERALRNGASPPAPSF